MHTLWLLDLAFKHSVELQLAFLALGKHIFKHLDLCLDKSGN